MELAISWCVGGAAVAVVSMVVLFDLMFFPRTKGMGGLEGRRPQMCVLFLV